MKASHVTPCLLLGMTLAAVPVVSGAQVVADPGAGAQGPAVEQTRNGIPQVDITAPSGAGVSHNIYSQFDVPPAGVILNNSPSIVQTRQAGMISGNPNLGPGQAAQIIVNEVSGDLPSHLRGYLEVAGERAEVVVANGNGIVVDGAGFINTTRGILTTGLPGFGASGSLDGFDVARGELAVKGAGLNASNVDQLDLIARAVSTDAAIHANTLNIVAGGNRVDHGTLTATRGAALEASPAVRIDVSELGGFHANRIVLVATEAGVGVSSRGVFAAQAGDLTLTAEGRVFLAGKTHASGDLALSSSDGIDNSGTTSAAQSVSVRTTGDIRNSGLFDAQRELTIAAGDLVSTGTLTQSGTGPTTIAVAGTFDNTNGTLQTHGNEARVTSATLVNDHGRTVQAGTGSLHISGGSLSNQGGAIGSSGTIVIRATDVSNRAGMLSAQRQVELDVRSLDNAEGGYIGTDDLTLTAQDSLNNRGGKIEANRNLTIAAQDVSNQAGSLRARHRAQIDVRSIDNSQRGYVDARSLTLSVHDALDNREGTVEASEGLAISAQSVLNGAGSIRNSKDGSLSIATSGPVSNTQGGRIDGNGTLRIVSSGFDNIGGRVGSEVGSGGDVSLTTGWLANDHGVIDSDQDLGVSATSMAGDGFIVASRDAVFRIDGDYTHDVGNGLHAKHDLTLTTAGNFMNRGQLGAVNSLTVNAANVHNRASASLNSASTVVNASGTIDNRGRLEGETLTTRSAALSNFATIVGRTVTLNADTISNTGAPAVIAGAGEVNLYARDRFSNTGQANVFSLGDINIAADSQRSKAGAEMGHSAPGGWLVNRANTVINDQSTLEAGGNLEIAAGTLINARPAPLIATVTTGVDTRHERKRDKYTACATGNAVVNSTCSQSVWNFGYKVPRNVTYEASQIVSASRGPNPVDRLLVIRGSGKQQTIESIYYNAMTEHGDGSITVTYWDGYDPNVHYDPATEYPTRSDGHKGYQRVEFARDTTTTTQEDRVMSAAPPAQVIAGGNIMLANAGKVDNHYGAIAAGRSIWIGGGRHEGQVASTVAIGPYGTTIVNNTGRTLYRYETRNIVSRYAWNKEITRDVGSVVQLPVVLPPVAIGGIGGLIVANDAVVIHAGNIHNINAAAIDSATGATGHTAGAHGVPSGLANGAAGHAGDAGGMGHGGNAGAGPWQSVIHAQGAFDLTLPVSGLYAIHAAPDHPYLIVTDLRLTSYTEFISSDYMLEQLSLNPQAAQKRLGDGLIEQQEVRRQITALTGRAHLPGYAGAQDEYRALMASGIRAARQFDLQPGIALTAAQMDALTSDIVWLVNRSVTLPDGNPARVLAPVVYLTRTHANDLRADGVVIAADDVELHAAGSVTNSGLISGRSRTVVAATDVVNRAGTIGNDRVIRDGETTDDRGLHGSDDVNGVGDQSGAVSAKLDDRIESTTVVSATRDVLNESGRIAGSRVAVLAGRDILNTTLADAPKEVLLGRAPKEVLVGHAPKEALLGGALKEGFPGSAVTEASWRSSLGGAHDGGNGSSASATLLGARGTIASTRDMVVQAGRDLTVHGSDITAGIGGDGHMQLVAGRNITVDTVESTTAQSVTQNGQHHWEATNTRHQASSIAATDDLTMRSGSDTTLRGARIASGKDLTIHADGNLLATAVLDDARFDNVATDDEARQEASHAYDQRIVRSVLSAGRNATLMAVGPTGNAGLTLTGSSVIAGANGSTPGTATFVADGDITLDDADEAHDIVTSVSSQRGSVASRTNQMDHVERTAMYAVGSTVSGDRVDIRAGNDLTVKGSNVVGTNDVAMTAQGKPGHPVCI